MTLQPAVHMASTVLKGRLDRRASVDGFENCLEVVLAGLDELDVRVVELELALREAVRRIPPGVPENAWAHHVENMEATLQAGAAQRREHEHEAIRERGQ